MIIKYKTEKIFIDNNKINYIRTLLNDMAIIIEFVLKDLIMTIEIYNINNKDIDKGFYQQISEEIIQAEKKENYLEITIKSDIYFINLWQLRNP